MKASAVAAGNTQMRTIVRDHPMSDYQRMIAKYKTVCPRCNYFIKVGTTIVMNSEGRGRPRWTHSVCPKDVVKRKTDGGIEAAVTRTILEF